MPKKTAPSPRAAKLSGSKSAKRVKKSVSSSEKTAKKIVSAKRVSDKSSTFWSRYCREREAFYQSHPHARFLIGLLIIAMAVAFGMAIHDWKEVYVGIQLDKEGIHYPYVKPVGIK